MTINSKKQSGFTLIELTMAIALMGVMLSGLGWMTGKYADSVKNQVTAQYTIKWMKAADQYVKDNSAALLGLPPPAMITTADLIAAGLLDAGTAATNPYMQTVCAKVLQTSPGLLSGLVISSGGQTIGEGNAIDIAVSIGPNGGYTSIAAPTTASGSYGGWSVSTAGYLDCAGAATTAGHIAGALFFNNTKVLGDYVYRASVAGHPEANTMTAPLQFGAAAVQILNGACGAADLGKLARDAGGHVLMCDGANWKTQGSAFWQDAVVNFAALPVCNAAALNQTRIVNIPSVGTGPRAYTCDGAVWLPLGVNDQGNLSANTLTPYLTVTNASSCAGYTSGTLAQSSTTPGLILSCQSDVWKTPTSKSWVNEAMAATAFDPNCEYQVPALNIVLRTNDPNQIQTTWLNGNTTTGFVIYATNKSSLLAFQTGGPTGAYQAYAYPSTPVAQILKRCF